jgi:hypothetical protein
VFLGTLLTSERLDFQDGCFLFHVLGGSDTSQATFPISGLRGSL